MPFFRPANSSYSPRESAAKRWSIPKSTNGHKEGVDIHNRLWRSFRLPTRKGQDPKRGDLIILDTDGAQHVNGLILLAHARSLRDTHGITVAFSLRSLGDPRHRLNAAYDRPGKLMCLPPEQLSTPHRLAVGTLHELEHIEPSGPLTTWKIFTTSILPRKWRASISRDIYGSIRGGDLTYRSFLRHNQSAFSGEEVESYRTSSFAQIMEIHESLEEPFTPQGLWCVEERLRKLKTMLVDLSDYLHHGAMFGKVQSVVLDGFFELDLSVENLAPGEDRLIAAKEKSRWTFMMPYEVYLDPKELVTWSSDNEKQYTDFALANGFTREELESKRKEDPFGWAFDAWANLRLCALAKNEYEIRRAAKEMALPQSRIEARTMVEEATGYLESSKKRREIPSFYERAEYFRASIRGRLEKAAEIL